MRKIIWGFVTLATAAWLLNLAVNPPAMNPKALSHEILYLNGLLAWGLMALAIVIAARPAWIEKATGTPLDELYKWHKSLGIGAAVLTFVHFFSKDIFAPVVAVFATQPTPPKAVDVQLAGFDAFWADLRDFAVTSSEWSVYIGLVLIALTFMAKLRYSRWLTTHRLFSILFLVLAVHSIRLMDAADALTPFGLLNIAVTVIGCWYSVKILVSGAGRETTVCATVTRIDRHEGLNVITVKPAKKLNVRRGQFAFLRTPGHEKHPFSIAEVNDDGTIAFAVKALGDYTKEAVPQLREGDEVLVEGPWGHFLPDFAVDKQLWLAGGVGIAPFCAWLTEAARHAHGAIRLVWCIRSKESEPLYAKVEKLAREAGVTLEVHESAKARLNARTLFEGAVPETVALCAGKGLASVVADAYIQAGGSRNRIRREYFSWR